MARPETADLEHVVTPGQACSYKIGETTIANLRAEAERKLGGKFDLRNFHEAVLATGAVPLTVLERSVRAWASEAAPT